ncbi:chymotrypsin-1-like [Topomyia yanbarensis]|uniref:chymotrypsin-1-like n=1 Tax=Topomyia yanbarensis TaxID=2498891 RepID=UPI00273A9906|nr:chymotrypsin-1-like [Topomyia yanbarensis]
MFKFAGLVLIVLVAAVSAASLKNGLTKPAENEKRGRIAGGTEATVNQFPYQAALLTPEGLYFCGATILNQRWVVTSAACVAGLTIQDVQVFVGSNLLTEGGVLNRVSRIIAHPNFNVDVYESDVALIQVVNTLLFNDSIQPIAMRRDYVEAERNATVSGFGRQTISDSNRPDQLRFLQVEIITQNACQEAFDEPYTQRLADNTLCTLSPEGQGNCLGDAGGPLVYNGELVGVISWGIPCGLGMPDVYARISNHRAWILVHTMM